LHSIRLFILASAALIALLTAQEAIGRRAPTENLRSSLDPSYSINLDPEIDSVRKVSFTLAPGGIAKFHSKIGRPTLLQVIKGTLTSHPQGRPEAILHAGDGLVEIDDGNYWVENTGSNPAEFIFLHVHDTRTH
jgi:quercetin dioxygenase-like cupin family protein